MEKNNYKWIVKTIPFFKLFIIVFFFSSRRRHTSLQGEWSSDVCSSDLMLAISDEMQRQGLDSTKSSLRIGIFGAEPWTDELRRNIEERLKIDAIDIYGLSEVMGPGVAQDRKSVV